MNAIRRVAAATALAVVGITGTTGIAYAGDYSPDNSSDHHHHHDSDDDHHHRCGRHDDYHHFDRDDLLSDLLGFGHHNDYENRCYDRDHHRDRDNGFDFGGFNGNGF